MTVNESISLNVNLRAYVRRDTPRRWVATCPLIGVTTQAKTADDARRCLQEAVELWFESCVERGVLDHALREANFRPFQASQAEKGDERNVRRRGKPSVLGELFDIHLTIPAYQAATFLSATA
jgi:predicted RNase H-like HicB family nuclease